MMPTNRELCDTTDAYVEMVQCRLLMGWIGYLVTFMFNPLQGGPAQKAAQMQREIERVSTVLLNHMFRYPKNVPIFDMPFWIGCADWPVPKLGFNRDHYVYVAVNDGLHFHMLLLIPPFSRLKVSFDVHAYQYQERYFRSGGAIHFMKVDEITQTPEKVTRYVLKSLQRRRIASADVFVLPRAHSEMSEISRAERRMERDHRVVDRFIGKRQRQVLTGQPASDTIEVIHSRLWNR